MENALFTRIPLRKSLIINPWRREWDSNPRIHYGVFMDVRHRPNRLKYLICIQERKVLNKYGRYQYVTSRSMASITKKLRSKYWFACFRDLHGHQHRRSTGQTDRKKALEIARHYELVAQRRLKPQRVKETLSELYHQIYGETIPSATVRQYVADWLAVKEHEAARASMAAYRKSAEKFLAYLGATGDVDIGEIRKTHILGFRNEMAKKLAPRTANFDLKCIKAIFRAARRDGYLLDNPAEFVDTVRRESDAKRRPFTLAPK